MTPSRTLKSPLAWLGGLIVLYLGYPLAAFLVRLVTSPRRGFHAPGLFPALWVSIMGATISLAIVTVFGVPLAFVLARSKGNVASIVGLIVQIPLALPPLMSGIVLVYVIGPYTFLGQLFGEHLTESMVGVVIAMSFVSSPFLVVASRAAFASVDQGLLDVAAALGHGDVSRFCRVALPSAGAGVRAGMLLTWLRAFGEYGAVVILAYNPASLPIYTYNQFSGRGLPTTLAPTALALVVAAVVVALSRARVPIRRSAASSTLAVRPASVRSEPVRFDLNYRLGDFHLALAHDSDAQHLAVLGPSGSGKSALLRCLAGLYGSSPGDVWYGEASMREVAVERRGVGYVAQGFSLYPHLSVWRHLMFSKEATPELASYWLDHLQLNGLEDRLPHELSGGQRQRVGLAQVLCRSPRVLLLDEPFSALDVPVRRELRRELRQLQRETNLATVLVTHDPEEAAFLADELMVISQGRLLQHGTSRSVFTRPLSRDVARLVGVDNVHRARLVSSTALEFAGAVVVVEASDLAPGTTVNWSIRPEGVTLARDRDVDGSGEDPGLEVRLVDVVDTGSAYDLYLEVRGGHELRGRVWMRPDAEVGSICRVALDPSAIALWRVEVVGEAEVTRS